MILSRHPSHSILRTQLPLQKFRSLIRLGSTTAPTDGKQRIEINSVQGVKNSSSKLLMKQCFTRVNVKTADWWTYLNNLYGQTFRPGGTEGACSIENLSYPIIAKSHHGSRGEGNFKLDNQEVLEQFLNTHNPSNYIFEKFHKFSREYRLHVTNDGCFYTCRKLLRNDVPENTWQRHDDVCTWVLEDNPSFKKPNNWDHIVADCIRAKNALELDICAFDVLVQGTREGRTREAHEWLILESCSAPSFGTITGQKYLVEIDRLLKQKYNESLER